MLKLNHHSQSHWSAKANVAHHGALARRLFFSSLFLFSVHTSWSDAAQTLLDSPAAPPKGGQNPMPQNAASKLNVPKVEAQKFEGPTAKAYEAYVAGRYDEAMKLVKPLVDKENPEALYLMGIAHESGQGAEASREKALEFYQKAAKKSHKDASLRITMILLSSDKYQERDEARKLLEEMAVKDVKTAGRVLGEAWLRGGLLGDKPDPKQAISWWERAASAGDIPSKKILANLYEGQMGNSEFKDQTKALKLYSEAADLGDVESMVILGSRLLNGDEAFRNEVRGFYWLNKAAEAGGTAAHFVLGNYQETIKTSDKAALAEYMRGVAVGDLDCMVQVANFSQAGRGMNKDVAKARELLREASQKGSPQAQFQYAMMLASEEKPNFGVIYVNLLSAANGNILPAQSELGLLYIGGQMGLADPISAVAWFTRAAKSGYAPAQNSLAALYESGSAGLERNMEYAGELYKLAANQGHPDAMLAIVRLTLSASTDKKDFPNAWAQVSLIAEQGHKGAEEMAKQIADQLDEKQLAEAKNLLKKYKAAQPASGQK
jgi:uncharacterized protein